MKMYCSLSYKRFYLVLRILLFPLFTGISYGAYSQVTTAVDSVKTEALRADSIRVKQAAVLAKQFDVADLFRDILNPKKVVNDPGKKSSGITIVPNIASNPTFGSQLG